MSVHANRTEFQDCSTSNQPCHPEDVFIPMDTFETKKETVLAQKEDKTDCNSVNKSSRVTKNEENNHHNHFHSVPDLCQKVSIYTLNSRLLDAVLLRNNEEVASLLQIGASPNATCAAVQMSACHLAAYANTEALSLLIKHKAIKNRRDKFGNTPLHVAAWAGNNCSISLLLGFSNDLKNKINNKITTEIKRELRELIPQTKPMVDISCADNIDISEMNLCWNDSVEHDCKKLMTLVPKFSTGWTPLHIASYAGHHNSTRLLLAAGANPNAMAAMGNTPLDVAGGACSLPNHKINVNSYVETLKVLIEYGGVTNTEIVPRMFGSALHTAVELCNLEAIELLLTAGAPVAQHNSRGNTPLHECVLKFYEEPLKLLAQHKHPGQWSPTVNITDTFGYTVLHRSILASWIPGVRIALDTGADVTQEANDGFTAVHLAARKGNLHVLNELLKVINDINVVTNENGHVETPLICAVLSGNIKCVKAILDTGASFKFNINSKNIESIHYRVVNKISVEELKHSELQNNIILHATAEVGIVEILELLFNYDKSLETLLNYQCPYLMNMIPVEFAALHNKYEVFKFLLHKTVEQTKLTKQYYDPYEVLWTIILGQNNEDMLREVIRLFPNALQFLSAKQIRPLHEAIWFGKKNMIKPLIENGADLSERDEAGNTAIKLLIKLSNRPKPKELLDAIFDSCIEVSDYPYNTSLWEITVNYRVLAPVSNPSIENKGQMRVLKALLDTGNSNGQRKLLTHPLIESFLYLKWHSFSKFFYLMVFLYSLFIISLSAYIVSVFYYKDKAMKHPYSWSPLFLQIFIYISVGIILVQELSSITLIIKNWVHKSSLIECMVKCGSFALGIAIPLVITTDFPSTQWERHLATLTLVLTWSNIMLLLSKTPVSGYYMQMFWNVSIVIIKILMTFLSLIVMFSFCFMVEFHTQEPFDGPFASIVKTLVMMTSEFDYENNFSVKKAEQLSTSVIMLRIVFVVFLILTAIVLMNLMIGVAVHDVQDLVHKGNLRRLEKQVEFLYALEVSRGNKSYFNIMGLYRWFKINDVPDVIKFTSNDSNNKGFYNRRIREALINKVLEQSETKNKIKDSTKIHTKLEELFQALTKKEDKLIGIESKLDDVLSKLVKN